MFRRVYQHLQDDGGLSPGHKLPTRIITQFSTKTIGDQRLWSLKKEKKNTEIRGMRRTLFYLTILSRWWRFNAGQHHINLRVFLFFCLGWHRVWYSRHGRVYTNCVEKKKLFCCVCVCRDHNDNLDDDDGNIRLPGPKLKALKIKLIGKKSWNSAHLPSFPTTRGTTATGSIIHTHIHCVCTRTDKSSLSLFSWRLYTRGADRCRASSWVRYIIQHALPCLPLSSTCTHTE